MEKTKLLLAVVALTSFFLSLSPLAAGAVNEVTAWVDESMDRRGEYLEEAKQFKEEAKTEILKLMQAENEEKSCCAQREPEQNSQAIKTQDKPAILIFVSLSMPKESLKNLYREAEQQGLSLLIRGLKNNSFKDTASALKELEIAVQIDPQLFEEYAIQSVPHFVRTDTKEPVHLQGNVSLQYAQKKFEEAL